MGFIEDLVKIGTPTSPANSMMSVRQLIVNSVEALNRLLNSTKIHATLQMGSPVDMGSQFNILVRPTDVFVPIPGSDQGHTFPDIFFRAYIPHNGLPTHLDFLNEGLVKCESIEEVQTYIKKFFGNKHTKDRISAYKLLELFEQSKDK